MTATDEFVLEGAVAPLLGNQSRLFFSAPVISVGGVYKTPATAEWLSPSDPLIELRVDDSFTRFNIPLDIEMGGGVWIAGPQFVELHDQFAAVLDEPPLRHANNWFDVIEGGWRVRTGGRHDFIALNQALANSVMGLFWRVVDSGAADRVAVLNDLRALYEGLFLQNSIRRQINRAHFYSAVQDHVGLQVLLRASIARGIVHSEVEIERQLDEEWQAHQRMIRRSNGKHVDSRDARTTFRAAAFLENRISERRIITETTKSVLDIVRSSNRPRGVPVNEHIEPSPTGTLVDLHKHRLQKNGLDETLEIVR